MTLKAGKTARSEVQDLAKDTDPTRSHTEKLTLNSGTRDANHASGKEHKDLNGEHTDFYVQRCPDNESANCAQQCQAQSLNSTAERRASGD